MTRRPRSLLDLLPTSQSVCAVDDEVQILFGIVCVGETTRGEVEILPKRVGTLCTVERVARPAHDLRSDQRDRRSSGTEGGFADRTAGDPD